jgi:hypothetical protein
MRQPTKNKVNSLGTANSAPGFIYRLINIMKNITWSNLRDILKAIVREI